MTPSERAFYEWFNANPQHQGDYVPLTRDIWIAGWDAAAAFIASAFEPEPEPEPEPDYAEESDQAAADYARIETGEL